MDKNSEQKSHGADWTTFEEEHLAISCITVGKEPKWANNQGGLEFWKQVTKDFNARSNIVQCDWEQRKSHWGNKIYPATLKFSSCYANISHNLRSGTSLTDWLCQAKAFYSSEKNSQ
ncbi:hypothetical protein CROQUDRAFT_48326 [Cronartium quercuum f. sp. fusiforme G11]|uniref:Myb/SANT-like domain-containing protein n=1 Tax=Cronartium quercuum f. sp. fusiforme G11 TaxID=708437 RepID=A0A9P6NGQ8_9BASI|nr:hypothetical protein CROQUDRAFT_48326 [Cronartium quercuum f. sp. fusiforme G11]